MSIFTDIWRQLVRRRLWPVALLLAAAAAAIPFVLAKEPEVAATTAALAPEAESALTKAPIVTASTATTREAGRKVIGKHHDIFKSTAKKPKVKATAETDTASEDTSDDTGGSSPAVGGAPSPSPTFPSFPSVPGVPGAPAPKPKTYAHLSLTVRFGSTDADLLRKTLPKKRALPSEDQPLLIYLGVLADGKTAVFLLDASAKAQGDGECDPTPESCEKIHLKVGETEFIDVLGENNTTTAQYQLDLVQIHKSKTTDPAKAAKSATVSSIGRDLRSGAGKRMLRGLGAVGRTG